MQKFNPISDPIIEHMWISDVLFDGDMVSGTLINDPLEINNVKNGDHINIPLGHISDWLFSSEGKTYGGFTIQAMRAEMSPEQREEYDNAWGLDFGDFNDILLVREHPEHLIEHPMSINMQPDLMKFIKAHPSEITDQDESGYTLLHRETIAGNRSSVEALIQYGSDISARINSGKTSLDFAKQLKWEHIITVLQQGSSRS